MGSVQEVPRLDPETGKRTVRYGRRGSAGWRAVWRDNDGRQRSQHFARKADAEKFLSQVEADLIRGQYVDPAAGRTTLDDYVTKWAAAQVWRPSTRDSVEGHLRRYISPHLGDRSLATITRTDVQGFVNTIAAKLAPSTTEVVYRRLVTILGAAVADRYIGTNPATKIQLPKKNRRTPDQLVVLDLAAVRRVAEVVPPLLEAFVWLLAGSGLRPGEAAGLTVDRVDFLRRQITVDRQLVTTATQGPHLAAPKSESSVRTVPVTADLCNRLAHHIDTYGTVDLDGETLIFANSYGNPWRRGTLADRWSDARKRADLPAAARGWHELRHFYASMLIGHGVSVRAVQARLGHATASQTLDTYAALWPDSDDDTRAAVEKGLQADRGSTTRAMEE